MRFLLIALLCFPLFLQAQTDAPTPREAAYAQYEVLLGTWELQAFFTDGTALNQKMEITRGLEGSVFKVSTYQKDDSGTYQLKSEGFRAWDDRTRSMKFWDFGVDGSITTGTVAFDGQNILHIYSYNGQILTDWYGYEDGSVYEFILGVKDGDQWLELYANGGYRKMP